MTSYDCFRNIVDQMFKTNPDYYRVACKIHVPPALVEKAFGKGYRATRNGKYSTKEWDFTDINNDKFLVFDYKSTTEFWGPNLPAEEYQVSNFFNEASS